MSFATSLCSIFIQDNTESTIFVYIFSILEERLNTLLKLFLVDIDRLTLLRCLQDVIFEDILKCFYAFILKIDTLSKSLQGLFKKVIFV